jgi:hypothetical protein
MPPCTSAGYPYQLREMNYDSGCLDLSLEFQSKLRRTDLHAISIEMYLVGNQPVIEDLQEEGPCIEPVASYGLTAGG